MSSQDARPSSSMAAVLIALAVVVLGYALQWTHGHYHAEGIKLVVMAWAAVLAALLWRARSPIPVEVLVGMGITAQLYLLAVSPPTVEMHAFRHPTDLHSFIMGLTIVAAIVGTALGAKPAFPKVWFPAAVVIHAMMGALILKLAPTPVIDVFGIEIDSIKALLGGVNPYGITFPNPYGDNSPFFPPGVSVNGRLQFGFVYPPLALLLCVPGQVLFGDPRYSMLMAMSASALLMGYARPGTLPKLAAVLFLFTPRSFFVLDRAWTDPFVVLVVAAVAFTAIHRPKYVWVAAGFYLCLKQHMFIGIPALLLLVPRPMKVREVATLGLKAGGVALAITAPFFLWGPAEFINSVLNIREVYRLDSLGLVAHLANQNITRLSKWSGLLAIVPVAALGLWKAPRSVAGFALLTAATHFTLYLFSTHAFCNEYYNVLGSLCVALAVLNPGEPSVSAVSPAV